MPYNLYSNDVGLDMRILRTDSHSLLAVAFDLRFYFTHIDIVK